MLVRYIVNNPCLEHTRSTTRINGDNRRGYLQGRKALFYDFYSSLELFSSYQPAFTYPFRALFSKGAFTAPECRITGNSDTRGVKFIMKCSYWLLIIKTTSLRFSITTSYFVRLIQSVLAWVGGGVGTASQTLGVLTPRETEVNIHQRRT